MTTQCNQKITKWCNEYKHLQPFRKFDLNAAEWTSQVHCMFSPTAQLYSFWILLSSLFQALKNLYDPQTQWSNPCFLLDQLLLPVHKERGKKKLQLFLHENVLSGHVTRFLKLKVYLSILSGINDECSIQREIFE